MTEKPTRMAAFLLLGVSIEQMKHLLLSVMCAFFMLGTNAQNEKSLDLSVGYGLYRQAASMGTNISFSADYRFNDRYTIGQMSQFGFMHTNIETFRANYVNQHISLLALRNIFDNKHFKLLAGTGLGYTNYHTVELRRTNPNPGDAGSIVGTYVITHSKMQMSFPVTADISYKVSKTISIGARFGGYIPTQGGFFNYKFLNPQVKISL